jgi:hypothetical protein
MERRIFLERRRDWDAAERIDLALKTWRAFDVKAAVTYLRLCEVSSTLIESFTARLPDRFRGTSAIDFDHRDRRHYVAQVDAYSSHPGVSPR